jgi:hypothetical protein
MIQPFPRPVKPKVRTQTDDQVAKLGQLNQLVRDVNQLNLNQSTPTGIPYEWYPPAGLTTAGPKFTYLPGPEPGPAVELISYHIKGIYSISNNSANGFSEYLCTLSTATSFGGSSLFPGSITGMFQSGTGSDIITSPLAVGGLIEIDGIHVPLTDFRVSLYNYNNPEGFAWYAVVAEGSTTATTGSLTALMSYDIEFLLPNYIPAPTIFQD